MFVPRFPGIPEMLYFLTPKAERNITSRGFPRNHIGQENCTNISHLTCTLCSHHLLLQKETYQIHSQGVVQSVKAVCMILAKIETVDVSSKLKRVEDIVQMLTVCHTCSIGFY